MVRRSRQAVGWTLWLLAGCPGSGSSGVTEGTTTGSTTNAWPTTSVTVEVTSGAPTTSTSNTSETSSATTTAVNETDTTTTTTTTTSSATDGSSTTTSTASSSTTRDPGSSSTTGGAEDCLDGADNDDDALVDCADPDCGPGHECVPAVPDGWDGYFRVHSGAIADPPPPPCSDGSAPALFFDTPAPALCSACACGPVNGGACGKPGLSCWRGASDCTGAQSDFGASLIDGSCFTPSAGFFMAGAAAWSCAWTQAPALLQAGFCAPAGGQLTNPSPWQGQDGVCEVAAEFGGGCDAGQVCMRRGSDDYAGGACIRKTGQEACPAEFSTAAVELHTEAQDGRTCSPCSCGAGGTCSASFTVHDSATCGGSEVTLDGIGECVDTSAQFVDKAGSILPSFPATPGGSCPAGGGAPLGKVTPTDTLTLCCR